MRSGMPRHGLPRRSLTRHTDSQSLEVSMLRLSRRFVLYPFLLALWSPLTLLAANLEQLAPTQAVRTLAFSILVTAALFVFLRLLLGDSDRAAWIVTLLLVAFFSYGHVAGQLSDVRLGSLAAGGPAVLVPLFVAVLVLGIVVMARWPAFAGAARGSLNALSLALLAVPCALLLLYAVQVWRSEARLLALARGPQGGGLARPSTPPDIYYIILDSYSRGDNLESTYRLDVSDFLGQLEGLGFTVIPCSQSNYAFTGMSLASSLNMDYLEGFTDVYSPGKSAAFGVSAPFIKHSLVRRVLESLGYRTVAFESGWEFSQVTDADVYLAPPNEAENGKSWLARRNDFERLELSTTAAVLLPELSAYQAMRSQTLNGAVSAYAKPRQRERVLFALSALRELPAEPGPKFVFAHIVSPHYPFVLGPNGEAIDDRQDTDPQGYVDQILYLNKRLIPILRALINESSVPPVILLQGDHGTRGLEQKTKILSAYFLPENGRQMLYPRISPVNSFRVVLNSVFDAHLDLLPDRSLFSYAKTIYQFEAVEDVGRCAVAGSP